jgi:hypothetical protein
MKLNQLLVFPMIRLYHKMSVSVFNDRYIPRSNQEMVVFTMEHGAEDHRRRPEKQCLIQVSFIDDLIIVVCAGARGHAGGISNEF